MKPSKFRVQGFRVLGLESLGGLGGLGCRRPLAVALL